MDKQGRILIPAVLREYAGLKKDVVLAGVYNKVEIWDKERWDESQNDNDMEDIAEHMGDFGIEI